MAPFFSMKVSIDDSAAVFSSLSLITASIATPEAHRKLLFGKNLFLEDARPNLKMDVSLNAASMKASKKEASDCLSSVGCDMIQGHY